MLIDDWDDFADQIRTDKSGVLKGLQDRGKKYLAFVTRIANMGDGMSMTAVRLRKSRRMPRELRMG